MLYYYAIIKIILYQNRQLVWEQSGQNQSPSGTSSIVMLTQDKWNHFIVQWSLSHSIKVFILPTVAP